MELTVSKRSVLHKKVKLLRKQGTTPVHLFGQNIESMALQTETTSLERSLASARDVQLINLKVEGEDKTRPVLVHEIQRDFLTRKLLHVDFYQIKMGQKVEVEVTISLVGDAPGLKTKGARLIREMDKLTIECQPDNIPASLELDISSLAEPGHALRVKDIVLGPEVTAPGDPERVVARIVAHVEERPTAEEAQAKTVEEVKSAEESPKKE